MKTAMQELIEYADTVPFGSKTGVSYIRNKMRKLLEIEKMQIEAAWWDGHDAKVNSGLIHVQETIAVEYYNKTFTKNLK